MKKILITDGRSLAALAIARSLGEKGFEVHCGEEFYYNITFFSKYVKRKIIYPSPERYPDRFVDEMLSRVQKENYDFIIPVRDDTTILFSKHKEEFSKYTKLYLSNYQTIKGLRDKGATIKIAQKYGVPVPKTYFPEDMDVVDIKRNAGYPLLIRPRISSGARGICYVGSMEEFDESYIKVKKEYGLPMIQEYVSHDGGHYSVCALFNESSEIIATHVYKEIKQYPVNGGPAVTAISVAKDTWVDDMLRFLQGVRWVGPVHMDVLYDSKLHEPKLLEVNPRFWMSLNLSIKSGVDFPYLLCKLAEGKHTEPLKSYKTGIKYRWVLPNEILWMLQTPNKFKGIRELLNFREKETCYAELSFEDPMPVAGVILQSLNYILNPEKRKLIFKRGWAKESRTYETSLMYLCSEILAILKRYSLIPYLLTSGATHELIHLFYGCPCPPIS
jgi:predicted ATP-grasp superfamily ATP-dependent carboligase